MCYSIIAGNFYCRRQPNQIQQEWVLVQLAYLHRLARVLFAERGALENRLWADINLEKAQETAGDGPRLEYQVHLFSSGEIKIRAYLFPTLDFHYSGGLKYTISIDDEDLQIINIHEGATNRVWEQWLRNNINLQVSKHYADRPGDHTVKFWMVDPGIVLEKLEVVTGESKAIFLGPAESHYQSEAEGK